MDPLADTYEGTDRRTGKEFMKENKEETGNEMLRNWTSP